MAPKSKVVWKQCDQCKVILWEKDVQIHRELCSASELETNKCLAVRHGFVENCNLYAVVKLIKDDRGGFSRVFNKDIAFLHPSSMKICKICCADKIIITSSLGYQTLHIVWPDSLIPPTTVMISKHSLLKPSAGEIVQVRSYDCCLAKARLVTLLLENSHKMDFIDTSEFKATLLNQNCGHFIASGTRIFCRYFGNLCEFLVKEIDEERSIEVKILEENAEMTAGCINEMTALTLEDSTDSSVLKSSTPIKNNMQPLSFHVTSQVQRISKWENRFYVISPQTRFKVLFEDSRKDCNLKINFSSIGGLSHQIQTLKEILHLLKHSFSHPGLMPKGILLCGPTGTGKTMMAHAIANEWSGTFISIGGPKIYSSCYGETEAKLKEIFEEASEKAPTIIFIDEIDSICPKRQGIVGVEERIIVTLHSLIDDLSHERNVLVIGATNRPESMDPGLQRPGRLERIIEFGFPTANERYEILQNLLKSYHHTLSEEEIKSAANELHGTTGADLAVLCRNAWFNAAEEYVQSTEHEPIISSKYFALSVKNTKPSALRGISVEIPKVRWTDIGGMQSVKNKLQQLIDWPRTHREVFQRMGISQRRGLLMYGPPGCSKTMIAKAVATESGLNFIAIKGPELFNKWVGESEKSVRELFQRARSVAPCIIFFDEIDALAAERGSTEVGTNVADRVLAQLLTEMDGLKELNDVFIIAATNRPDRIDKALQRPGRLDSIIYIPLPDSDTRREILQIQFGKMPIAQDVQTEKLIQLTEGYSGAELIELCHQAALNAMSECINCECIVWKHFVFALEEMKPRTLPDMIKFYEDFARKGKSEI